VNTNWQFEACTCAGFAVGATVSPDHWIIVTETADPTMNAVKFSRQQLGSGTTGVTIVGATEYSVPPSRTVTVTGPPNKTGVKLNEQVIG